MKKLTYTLLIAISLVSLVSCKAFNNDIIPQDDNLKDEIITPGTPTTPTTPEIPNIEIPSNETEVIPEENWEPNGDVYITFSETEVTIEGLSSNYYQINGLDVSINTPAAMKYILSGKASDGRIVFTQKIDDWIVLDGLNLTSKKSSPLSFMKKAQRLITIADGTDNYLEDPSNYTLFDNEDNTEPNACLFAKEGLVINGAGNLTVKGNYNNGIGSKGTLSILGGNITVTALNNALKGNDALIIKNSNIVAEAKEDGLKADSVDDLGNLIGYITIEDAIINITSVNDAIQAAKLLYIKNSELKIITNQGTANQSKPSNSSTTSHKGLKADSDIVIESGIFNLDCYDDAIHANNTVNIKGGNFTIKTKDDAVHADNVVLIEGGIFNITTCYEGIEAKSITITEGDINIYATDDGINASSETETRPGTIDSSSQISILGGNIVINSSGDSIDSNGNLTISGGYVYLNGPSSTPDEGLDADGAIYLNGGTIYAYGPSSLMETPSTQSTQNTLVIYFSSQLAINTKIKIVDNLGNIIFEDTLIKQQQSLIISLATLAKGNTYSIYCNDALFKSATISTIITTIGSPTGGSGGSNGPGGGGGGGGGPRR